MKVVNIAPSIETDELSVLLVKVLPFGPEPVIVYLVTSSSVLSDGSSVLLPLSTSVERMSFIVVVPGFSEHDASNATAAISRISAFVAFMFFLMFFPPCTEPLRGEWPAYCRKTEEKPGFLCCFPHPLLNRHEATGNSRP